MTAELRLDKKLVKVFLSFEARTTFQAKCFFGLFLFFMT